MFHLLVFLNKNVRIPIGLYWYEHVPMEIFLNKRVRIPIALHRYRCIPLPFIDKSVRIPIGVLPIDKSTRIPISVLLYRLILSDTVFIGMNACNYSPILLRMDIYLFILFRPQSYACSELLMCN